MMNPRHLGLKLFTVSLLSGIGASIIVYLLSSVLLQQAIADAQQKGSDMAIGLFIALLALGVYGIAAYVSAYFYTKRVARHYGLDITDFRNRYAVGSLVCYVITIFLAGFGTLLSPLAATLLCLRLTKLPVTPETPLATPVP